MIRALALIAALLATSCDDARSTIAHDVTSATVALTAGADSAPAHIVIETQLRALSDNPTIVAVDGAGLFDDHGQVAALALDFRPGTRRVLSARNDPLRRLEIVNVSTRNADLQAWCGQPLRLGVGLVAISEDAAPAVVVDWSAVVVDCSRAVAPAHAPIEDPLLPRQGWL